MNTQVKLKIAGITILIRSDYKQKAVRAARKKRARTQRFLDFLSSDNARPDIVIEVGLVSELPRHAGARDIFVTYHPEDGQENWRLMKKSGRYIYKSDMGNKQQLMLANKEFDQVTAYLRMKPGEGSVWSVDDIVYDFIQVLLINYLALRRAGMLVHGLGIKDLDGKGLLFAGESGAGKSTTGRIWYNHSKANVLNDDRIIVRKVKGKFFMYGCPWHGEFSDYLGSGPASAPLKNLFFIHHALENTVSALSAKEAFKMIYPVLFPAFWDKKFLAYNVSLSQEIAENVKCYRLGFVNNRNIIRFVRKI